MNSQKSRLDSKYFIIGVSILVIAIIFAANYFSLDAQIQRKIKDQEFLLVKIEGIASGKSDSGISKDVLVKAYNALNHESHLRLEERLCNNDHFIDWLIANDLYLEDPDIFLLRHPDSSKFMNNSVQDFFVKSYDKMNETVKPSVEFNGIEKYQRGEFNLKIDGPRFIQSVEWIGQAKIRHYKNNEKIDLIKKDMFSKFVIIFNKCNNFEDLDEMLSYNKSVDPAWDLYKLLQNMPKIDGEGLNVLNLDREVDSAREELKKNQERLNQFVANGYDIYPTHDEINAMKAIIMVNQELYGRNTSPNMALFEHLRDKVKTASKRLTDNEIALNEARSKILGYDAKRIEYINSIKDKFIALGVHVESFT